MDQPHNFQSIIMALQNYWAEYGCLIWQPYYSQVGAGTLNPATALRVLGPEPWNVAYVEPSIRPDDGRYGENPNRMQMHYQFQVILKPDPGDPQDVYLKSLQALGIDPRLHDIRFVEDNWESPALGAWGLGWEVWLDGQEITQFTYFQQSGGQVLDPVSVELTYGLERIAIALQNVDSFRDIQWSPALTDGDVNLQAEQEHSKYYFEVADVQRLRQMFDLFEAEAGACLAQNLVLPAHDYVLKCSHTFNVLDTRGAVGVTERQAFFARMRDLSRQVAESYLEQRQRLEYPFLDRDQGIREQEIKGQGIGDKGRGDDRLVSPSAPLTLAPLSPSPLLFEIGTEELPVGDLSDALDQLRQRVPALLDELRLEHGELRVMGTPRRLVVYVKDLSPRQSDLEQVIKGPPASRAFGPDGLPTQAALGFARSKGVAVGDLQVVEMDGGQYAAAVVSQQGKPALDVLAEALPGLIAGLRFDKPMRWNSSNVFFSRPIRWLMALYGEQVVPFHYAGLDSGNLTYGLRFHQPEEIEVQDTASYFTALTGQGIVLEFERRQQLISERIAELAAQVGGQVVPDAALLEEVTNLVEAPHPLRGSFDPSHLKLPGDVLISVMKKHQRYFPVEKDGRLLPYFIAVRNGDGQGLDVVTEGNEHVIRARFADAAYFVREDLKKPLEAYLPRLKTLTFQTGLGSMLDKTHRLQVLVDDLAPMLELTADEIVYARRAAALCKTDLVTNMVVEMTALQGIMGRDYALHAGEPQPVAEAIFEHYLPRYAGDRTPSSRVGLLLGLADRLDSLVGLFAVGLAPTGNKDPFAQRRAALGLVQNLIAWELNFDLQKGLEKAAAQLPVQASAESQQAVLSFIIERLRNVLLDQGWRYDVVDAVLAAQGANPAHAALAVRQLSAWVSRPDWHSILPAYARCVRITRDLQRRYPLSPELFVEKAESELYDALQKSQSAERRPGSVDDFLNSFLPLIPHINNFFDQVLVMADDEALRDNRLGLVQRVAALADGVADMSRLEGF